MGFHIVSAEDNVSNCFTLSNEVGFIFVFKVLDETLGLEGTEWGISCEKKEITLKQRGGESSTVIKSGSFIIVYWYTRV